MILRLLPLFLLVGPFSSPAQDAPGKIRVLILTGSNNHDWKQTTPKLKEILEGTGRFSVETTVPPEGISAENLKRFDAILSNWNSWGKDTKKAEEWPAEARAATLDFVRGGKGHVTVHAGGSSFYQDWPEYRKVSLVYWDLKKTHHGAKHSFKVRIDKPDHPITKGLAEFTHGDELWNAPGVAEGCEVLASSYSDPKIAKGTGQWEPAVVAASYGRGRCLATLLGHDAGDMKGGEFQRILVRGVEWAATGAVKGD
jgi:hypothetical protein